MAGTFQRTPQTAEPVGLVVIVPVGAGIWRQQGKGGGGLGGFSGSASTGVVLIGTDENFPIRIGGSDVASDLGQIARIEGADDPPSGHGHCDRATIGEALRDGDWGILGAGLDQVAAVVLARALHKSLLGARLGGDALKRLDVVIAR